MDLPRAAALFRRACEQESGAAGLNLGIMYQEGKGVRQDAAVSAALL
jgi:TPR repeat protein